MSVYDPKRTVPVSGSNWAITSTRPRRGSVALSQLRHWHVINAGRLLYSIDTRYCRSGWPRRRGKLCCTALVVSEIWKVSDLLPVQCRMARAAISLSVGKLAAAAKVAPETVIRFESGERIRQCTIDSLRQAMRPLLHRRSVAPTRGSAGLFGNAARSPADCRGDRQPDLKTAARRCPRREARRHAPELIERQLL